MSLPPRHLDDITAECPPFYLSAPRHYRVEMPPSVTHHVKTSPSLWWELLTELLRSVVYTCGAVLGLAIALSIVDYLIHGR